MRHGATSRARAGLTFLEVVVSIAILAGVGSIVFGVIGFTTGNQQRDAHRVEAMEVAHRVVLQWIDDPEWIRSQPKRYPYAGSTYAFEVREMFLVNEEDRDVSGGRMSATPTPQDEAGTREIITSGLRLLDVYVWREREDGIVEDEPLAHINRVYWLPQTARGQSELFNILLGRAGEESDRGEDADGADDADDAGGER